MTKISVRIDENEIKEEVTSQIADDIKKETKILKDEAADVRREIKRELRDEIGKYIEKRIGVFLQSASKNYIEDRIDSVIEERIRKFTTKQISGYRDFKEKLFSRAEEIKRIGGTEYFSREDAFHTGVECAYLVFNNIINPDDNESKKEIYDAVIFQVALTIADRIKLNKNTREKMAESIANVLSQMQIE